MIQNSNKKNSDDDILDKIHSFVEEGYSNREACRKVAENSSMNVETVISRWKRSQKPKEKSHGHMLLSDEKERQLTGVIEAFSLHHNPLSKNSILELVRKTENLVYNWRGESWYRGFLDRHKEYFSERKVKSLRGKRIGEEIVDNCERFIEILPKYLKDEKISWKNLVNVDETILSIEKGVFSQVYVETRDKSRSSKQSLKRGNTLTMMPFITTEGKVLMSVYIISSKREDNQVEMNLKKLGRSSRKSWPRFYAFTESGMMIADLWKEIMLVFQREMDMKTPGVSYAVLQDRLGCHTNAENVMEMKKIGIHTVLLPANTLHFLQSLDSFPFANFKNALTSESRKNLNAAWISKKSILDLMLEIAPQVEEEAFQPSTLISAFRETGIFPFDPEKIRANAKLNSGQAEQPQEKPHKNYIEEMSKILEDYSSKPSEKVSIKVKRNEVFTPDALYELHEEKKEAKKKEEEAKKERKRAREEKKREKEEEKRGKKRKKTRERMESKQKKEKEAQRKIANKCKGCGKLYRSGSKWFGCEECDMYWICANCHYTSEILQQHEENCQK